MCYSTGVDLIWRNDQRCSYRWKTLPCLLLAPCFLVLLPAPCSSVLLSAHHRHVPVEFSRLIGRASLRIAAEMPVNSLFSPKPFPMTGVWPCWSTTHRNWLVREVELANDIKVRCLVAQRRMLSFDSTNRYKH